MTDRHRDLHERLGFSDALLSRTDLAALGLPRRGIDAMVRAVSVLVLPGHAWPFVRAGDYLELRERSTYRDDRVRPT